MENRPEEKNKIPTPPPAKVSVRTMQSDIKSIQEDGGQMPQPYTAEISQPLKEETKTLEEIVFQAPGLGSNIPGYTGPEEPIFKTEASSPLPQNKEKTSAEGSVLNQAEGSAKPPKKGSKTLAAILGIVILAAILGMGGYYLVTKFIKTKGVALSPTVSAPPQEETIIPIPEKIPSPAAYVSLFSAPVLQEEKIISALTLDNVKNALMAAVNANPVNNLKEVILRDENQSLVGFSKFIPVILPELKSEEVAGFFEENFTATIFSDINGSWPGYVVKLKSTATVSQAQAFIKQNLESSANLKNFFLEEPGTAAAFKDGLAGSQSINTRYATFSKPRAAFNYGWANNNLVISASYAGLLEILKQL